VAKAEAEARLSEGMQARSSGTAGVGQLASLVHNGCVAGPYIMVKGHHLELKPDEFEVVG